MRITVISPFVDKRHGTERCLAELLERLARDYECEIHLYSQRVEDLVVELPLKSPIPAKPCVYWHKVPSIPGPHLLQYAWWFAANTILRWSDARSGRVSTDLLFSPGINAWGAEVVHVHIVFEEFYRRTRDQLLFRRAPLLGWPLLLHRRLYYSLVRWLESRIYPRSIVYLVAVSEMVSRQLQDYFGRSNVRCVRNGVSTGQFSPQIRLQRRSEARQFLEISPGAFVFLLIGNDWRKKGLEATIEAFGECNDLPILLLVVGRDHVRPFSARIEQLGLSEKIRFLAPSEDVMQFYAAAEAYLGPSLEDAFGMPVLEAMACGLPVIASVASGVSEIMEDNLDGLLLRDPRSVSELAALIRKLFSDTSLRAMLEANAPKTAEICSWDRSAAALWELLKEAIATKRMREGDIAALLHEPW